MFTIQRPIFKWGYTVLFCVLIIGYWLLAISIPPALADDMSSSSYKIQFSNVNITSGLKTSSSYRVTDTVGQTGAGKYGLANNVVKSGFQYIYPLQKFTFKISPTKINFGSLIVGNFATATETLEVTSVGAGGYNVTVSEDHPMYLIQNSTKTIPDTNCDTTCSETTTAVWTNAAKPGFGYNMAGDDVVAGFTNSTYYKQFANLAGAKTPQVIMHATGTATKRHGVLTYKIAVGATQDAGDYTTQITYIAIPGY